MPRKVEAKLKREKEIKGSEAEEEIKESGEIMELAKPEDEVEEEKEVGKEEEAI
jgi:hypothetical protein